MQFSCAGRAACEAETGGEIQLSCGGRDACDAGAAGEMQSGACDLPTRPSRSRKGTFANMIVFKKS